MISRKQISQLSDCEGRPERGTSLEKDGIRFTGAARARNAVLVGEDRWQSLRIATHGGNTASTAARNDGGSIAGNR